MVPEVPSEGNEGQSPAAVEDQESREPLGASPGQDPGGQEREREGERERERCFLFRGEPCAVAIQLFCLDERYEMR